MNAHHQQVADVYVEDGIIVAINPTITVSFTLLSTTTFSFCSFLLSNFIGISQVGDEVTVIDATGKFVMPGYPLIFSI